MTPRTGSLVILVLGFFATATPAPSDRVVESCFATLKLSFCCYMNAVLSAFSCPTVTTFEPSWTKL